MDVFYGIKPVLASGHIAALGYLCYPESARRWYTGTVVAHDKYHAFHFVLDKTDSRLDKDRRELIVFHPKEFVEASSGTTAWMSWCVGRPWRGYQAV